MLWCNAVTALSTAGGLVHFNSSLYHDYQSHSVAQHPGLHQTTSRLSVLYYINNCFLQGWTQEGAANNCLLCAGDLHSLHGTAHAVCNDR